MHTTPEIPSRRAVLVTVTALIVAVAALPSIAEESLPSSLGDILPDRYRLSPKDQVVRDAVVAAGGARLVYHDVFGQEIRSANLATGGRKTIGTNEGGEVGIQAAPVGSLVVYARTDGLSPIRRVPSRGGTIETTSVTSRNFAVGYRGATLFSQPGGETWYWALDGTERRLTADAVVFAAAGAPDRDLFVYRDFDGEIRVVTESRDESAGVAAPPAPTTATGIGYTWLGTSVLLDVSWASGDPTIWLVDTVSLTSREIGTGTVVHATPTRVLFETPDGEGYIGFLDTARSATRVGSLGGNLAIWAADDDVIAGSDGFDEITTFSWDGDLLTQLDVGANAQVVRLEVAGSTVVSELSSQTVSALFGQPLAGGPIRRITPSRYAVGFWRTGPDGWVYWTATRGDFPDHDHALHRGLPNASQRMRLSKWTTASFGPIAFGRDGDTLVFAYGGEVGYWALDLAATSRVACAGLPTTILGTGGNDVILGTDGLDIIASRGGDDVVRGGDGNDWICLGPGNDWGAGQLGNDKVQGNGGDDELLGHRGRDRLTDASGSNSANGGGGYDYCVVTGIVVGCEAP